MATKFSEPGLEKRSKAYKNVFEIHQDFVFCVLELLFFTFLMDLVLYVDFARQKDTSFKISSLHIQVFRVWPTVRQPIRGGLGFWDLRSI